MKKSILKIYVSLILLGDSLDPLLITSQLKVMPTQMHYKDTRKKTSTGTEYKTKTGLWSYDVDMPEKTLNENIENLILIFGNKSISTSQLFDHDKSFIDVYISTYTNEEGEISFEFDLTLNNLIGLKNIGLPIQFTTAITNKNILPYGTHDGFILP